VIRERDGIMFVASANLEKAGVQHGFVGRAGGISQGAFASLNLGLFTEDRPENAAANERRFREVFGVKTLIRVRQVHGREVLVADRAVEDEKTWRQTESDAIITDQPGVALAVLTADCVPIVLFDPRRRVAGIAHAGWRGTCLRVAAATVEAMEKSFGSQARDIMAGIGPGVGPCCYRVDEPVIRAAEESFGSATAKVIFRRDDRSSVFDLLAANRLVLEQAGLTPGNIESIDLCTSCRPDLFFSHRRDRGRTGRQINFVMLES
jgi:polyphenol oxidase